MLSVPRPFLALLFPVNDTPSDFIVGSDHFRAYIALRIVPRLPDQVADRPEKFKLSRFRKTAWRSLKFVAFVHMKIPPFTQLRKYASCSIPCLLFCIFVAASRRPFTYQSVV
jgi:hypothetical protein